jgi:hypothetical protein
MVSLKSKRLGSGAGMFSSVFEAETDFASHFPGVRNLAT